MIVKRIVRREGVLVGVDVFAFRLGGFDEGERFF